jgi:hypothetical protein
VPMRGVVANGVVDQVRHQLMEEACVVRHGGISGSLGAHRRDRRCRPRRRSTAIYASTKHDLVVIPVLAWGGGVGAAVLIGAVAGCCCPRYAPRACHPRKHSGACESWQRVQTPTLC